jgi:CDGSH-type Zn-finger protein
VQEVIFGLRWARWPHNLGKEERVIRQKGNIMEKTYKYEDIEQILAEADDLLQQIDPEIIEYLKEEQRAQLEQQVQSLKKLKSEVEDKLGKEGPSKSKPYSEGMHEAMEDIAKAMKALASYLS